MGDCMPYISSIVRFHCHYVMRVGVRAEVVSIEVVESSWVNLVFNAGEILI